MHVGIITYQTGHLKTRQLVDRLLTKSFRVTVFAFPFQLRPHTPGPFEERPNQIIDLDVPTYCRSHGVGYVEVDGWSDEFAPQLGQPGQEGSPDVFLTCIAKIIPTSFIAGRTIINAHPGLLPHNRGVDSFKWCVVNEWPFGVTLHVIDEAIDRGTILHRMRVPVLEGDTLRDVADRAYATEVDLQANFDQFLYNLKYDWFVGEDYPLSRKRVPRNIVKTLTDEFLKKREMFVCLSSDLSAQSHPADAAYPETDR